MIDSKIFGRLKEEVILQLSKHSEWLNVPKKVLESYNSPIKHLIR
jgi:hypothetical protein